MTTITKGRITVKFNSLFTKKDRTILDSTYTYRKLLMEDTKLTVRLTYNHHTYSSHLIEWTDSTVIFEAPMRGTDDVIIPNHAAINATLVSKAGLFHTTFTISRNYRQNNILFYVATITSPIIKKQQREAFRLDVLLDVHFDIIASENDKLQLPLSGQGTCVNISVGGMCLTCDRQLHAKDQLQLSFTLVDTPLIYVGEVLFLGERIEQGYYSHRIRFVGLDAADTNQLNRLIFTKQRQHLKHQ